MKINLPLRERNWYLVWYNLLNHLLSRLVLD